MGRKLLASAALAALMAPSGAWADIAAAERWIDEEFQPSVLSREEQLAELEWFIEATQPFQGMEVNVVAGAMVAGSPPAEALSIASRESADGVATAGAFVALGC